MHTTPFLFLIMKLSKEEKELILQKRQEEEKNRPQKEGFLKHDLVYFDSRYVEFDIGDIIDKEEGYYLTTDSVAKIIQRCRNLLSVNTIGVKKGTRFDCFIDDGVEKWYDDAGIGIEEYSKEWAALHLEKIKEI